MIPLLDYCMSVQNKVTHAGILAGRAINLIAGLAMIIVWSQFLLNQGPQTLANALMVSTFFAICMAGSYVYRRVS